MNWTLSKSWRFAVAAAVVLIAVGVLSATRVTADQHESTPVESWSCAMATPEASPMVGEMSSMDMGTPMADMDMGMRDVEFDQLYIDMMMPHHMSIIALSEAALPKLTDPRLIEIAETIIATQSAEIEELRGYREQFYGEAEPMVMHQSMMEMMMQAMPGMSSMDSMMSQMDPQAQVNAFCAAADPDLAFIDMTIPHHEMAIMSSEVALQEAVNEEIRAFAQRVIDDQQAEIDQLTEIRAGIGG